MKTNEIEFTWLNKQGVSSRLGFTVQMIDRSHIEYREGAKSVTVTVEMGMKAGTLCLLYSPGSFRGWGGGDSEESEESRVESNFQRALAFQGVTAVAEAPE